MRILRSRLGGSSTTSAAISKVGQSLRRRSLFRSDGPPRSARSSSASVARNFISFTPPEVDCIGNGNAGTPYEFGVNASIVTNNRPAPGGQFVLHAKALPDKPDGRTLRAAR